MAESASHDSLGRSRTEIYVEVAMAILLCLSAMSGNALVVYVINKDSRLHNITNILIHNLALTDIAMATIYMPFWIASLYTGTWNFAQVVCRVTASIMSTLANASIYTLGLIAFNRYIKVVKRSLYRKVFPSKRAARLYCALVWLAAICLSIPLLGGWVKVSYYKKFGICGVVTDVNTQLLAGILLNGVMIMIFYCYFKIHKAVRESTENLNIHGDRNGGYPSNDSRRSNMTDVRVLKTCFTVACFYVITWIPISIIVFTWHSGLNIPQTVYTASIFLMFSSSLINPIIYGAMNPQFTVAFKRILSCGRQGNRNTDENHRRNEDATLQEE